MRRLRLIAGYGLLFLLISLGLYCALVRIFTIRAIEVQATNMQVVVDNKRLPRTLLFFPSEKIRAQLLAANPILVDIQLKKKYPDTLVIIPTLRTPVAQIVTGTRNVFVDANGIVLADADDSRGLPVIRSGVEGIRVGQTMRDPAVKESIGLVTGLRDILPLETITVQNDGSLQATSGKINILFTQAPVADILATLQTLLSGFRIKGTLPTLIDLRFDKPIVKF